MTVQCTGNKLWRIAEIHSPIFARLRCCADTFSRRWN